MTADIRSRVREGVKEGGQFAKENKPETTVSLGRASHSGADDLLSHDEVSLLKRLNGTPNADSVDGYYRAALRAAALSRSILDGRVAHNLNPEDVPTDHEIHLVERRTGSPEADTSVGFYPALHKITRTAERMNDTRRMGATREDAVLSDDPRIDAGEIFDNIQDEDGTIWSRRREGVYADVPYGIRIQADRELTDDEVESLAGMAGYAYAQAGRGEGIGGLDRDSIRSFVIGADTTKGRVYRNLHKFEESLPELAAEGSRVRTTDRSGPGTKGTRLIEPLPGAPKIEIYYDSVSEF